MKIKVIDSHHTYIILIVLSLAAIIGSGNEATGQGNSGVCRGGGGGGGG